MESEGWAWKPGQRKGVSKQPQEWRGYPNLPVSHCLSANPECQVQQMNLRETGLRRSEAGASLPQELVELRQKSGCEDCKMAWMGAAAAWNVMAFFAS